MSITKSKSQPRKLAVVYMAHDGITSHYAGIGTYSMCYLYGLPEIAKVVRRAGDQMDIFLITSKYKTRFYGYKQSVKDLSLKICRQHGGKLIEVDDGLGGLASYGGIKNWEMVSAQSAQAVAEVSKEYDKVIVIAVDTPFLQVGEILAEQYQNLTKKVMVVLSPQSTERIHQTGDKPRLVWEKLRFKKVAKYPNVKVSYSSLYLKKHLTEEYGVASRDMVPSISGILFDSPRYKKLSEKRIKQILVSRGLPLDRKIVFSVGRLEAYKGFEDTMMLFRDIDASIKPYLVLVGVSYIPNNPLLPRLRQLKKDLQIDGKFIFNLDLELPTALWQWKNCLVSVHISKAEPFGLAPVEARYLAKNVGPVVVVSNQGGLKEQMINGQEGFVVKYQDKADYHRVAKRISHVSSAQLKMMRQRAYQNVVKKYDAHKNIWALLGEIDQQLKQLANK